MKKITILLTLFSITAAAQNDSNQFKNYVSIQSGIQSSEITSPVLGVNYGHYLNQKWSFRTGLYMNSFSGSPLISDSLLHEEDSIRIFRNQNQYQRTFSWRGGAEYSFNKYFRVGLDIFVGYSQNHISIDDRAQILDHNTGEWVWDNNIMAMRYSDLFNNHYRSTDQSSGNLRTGFNAYLQHANYLITGAALNIGAALPIGKRWELGLTYSTIYSRYSYLNSNQLITEFNVDGIEVYSNIQNLVTDFPSFHHLNHTLTAEVRLKF